ncbi:MAG: YafY family protein [Bacteroidota bacterium]
MTEHKPRLARLVAILTQLQSKRLVTARELADKHQVSIRTVYRDIRTLEQSGIPIFTEEGRGYSLVEGYSLPPVMFTEAEAHALITAAHLIRKDKDQSLVEHYERVVIKMKATLQFRQKAQAELLSERIQIRNNPHAEKNSKYLIQIQSALANFQVIQIDYFSLNEEKSQRKIEPFALYSTQGNWILLAYCRKRKDFRAFRLDRIQQLRQTGEAFEPHKLTLEQYFENCRKKWEKNNNP